MPNNIKTVFQNLDGALTGDWNFGNSQKHNNNYDLSDPNKVLFRTTDKNEYEKKKLELQQNAWLKDRWIKANQDLSVQAFAGLNNVKLMYRDADLMDAFPEIGAALDIYAEESVLTDNHGQVITVSSKSERIKAILEDLFVNRLDIQVMSQMIIRGMCKYGNQFMLLNIDNKNGVMGWRQLPVFNVERLENGITNPYGGQAFTIPMNNKQDADTATRFVWTDETNTQVPFRNWQIAHFRLINNSMYLPYGVSALNSARRHWRLLSLMEDMMLIYRLERSIERRVYKIYVGAIDDADVQAYVEDIANNFKRTPIIDPMTGQIDLRKNIMPVHKDTPIPLLDGRTITIEELAKEFNSGKTNYVYSIQDKTHKIVPGKVVWCGKNYTADKLVKITLDDDTHCIMAPEHELIMRDGSKKRADEVIIGESVMPFYRKKDENVKKEKDFSTISEYITKSLKNHTIKNIEWVGGDDVYCMTVVGLNGEDDRHNFALRTWSSDGSICNNGIFVSNCCDQDIFIPVRDPNAANPIETLPAAQNLTAIDDIKYIQNKVLTALRIPKTFLNFEDAAGNGQNLALMDVRFTRTINRIQQAFLMEMNKVASIHLYLLGFEDDLTNFTLSMTNPSTQAEQLEIDNITKKIGAIQTAVADPGGGIPIMSITRALKEIMKWSDKEIQENLEEIRLEKALANELQMTNAIIKRTGIFDTVDRIYGEPNAQYPEQPQGGDEQGGGGPMGGGGAPPPPPMGGGDDFGSGLDSIGGPGGEEGGEIGGNEGEMPAEDAASGGQEQNGMMESNKKTTNLITELVSKSENNKKQVISQRPKVYNDAFLINEEFNDMINSLDKYLED